MKTALALLTGLTLIGNALAGVGITGPSRGCPLTDGTASGSYRSAGPDGAWYRSNFSRNAIFVKNDTSDYMTFFVYSGSEPGTVSIDRMVRIGAPVYYVIVPPHQQSFIDQRGRYCWVCAKPGWRGIDLQTNRIVGS